MALGRISGSMLYANLERDGNDLAFETDLLYIDVTNQRIGINTNSPQHSLDLNGGSAQIGTITITGDTIRGASSVDLGSPTDITISGGTTGYVLTTDGNGVLSWASVGSLLASTGSTGMQIDLGTPSDSSLVTNAAWDGWTSSTKVTNAIDDLNQTALNIAKNTYVGEVTFTANVVAGPSPMTVRFTPSYTGNPDSYEWDFGDGNASTSEDPTHTYNNTQGGQFTVTVRAYNSTGTLSGDPSLGAVGSWDDFTRNNYITLYTPNPIPAFTITDTDIDSGSNGTITNNSQFATSFALDWGDSTTDAPTVNWTTLNHVYSNPGVDTEYQIQLDATSSTAGPTPVTVNGTPQDIRVYGIHTPAFTTNTIVVANEEATSGGVVTFTNTTPAGLGLTSTFSSNRYKWTWGDGDTNTINVQNGLSGNPSTTINHTFSLTATEQNNGTSATFDVTLDAINLHSASPFSSAITTITVEPDVRSNFAGANTHQSDRTGDDAQDGYVFTDYRDGTPFNVFEFTTTSQHADTYNWTWGDGQTDVNIAEGAAGTVSGGAIQHTYTSTGNKTVALAVTGQPASLTQTDTETRSNYITIRTNPSQPTGLSSRTLSMSTASTGTSPLLTANATDYTGGNIPAAGTSVTRYQGGTFVSSSITDVYDATTGTLTALIDGIDDGNVTFTTTSNNVGTTGSLIISEDADAHNAISSSTYPSGFYKVFSASISKTVTDFGYHEYKLSHSTTGDTNAIGFVNDSLSAVPTLDISGVTLTENTAGSLTYISGIPYYNTGGVVDINGLAVTNWIGQTYRSGSPLSVVDGPNDENTSGAIISTQTKTYADLEGVSAYLTGGHPQADTGRTVAYTFGALSVNINGSARAVAQLQASINNVNGTSTTVTFPTKINVYNQSISGFDEGNIDVLNTLGSGFSDDGKRVALGLGGDNPSYTPADFYTNNAWSGAETVAGTDEAIVRWGQLKHFTTDYSSGYLPVGPDLFTGRSGAQYFTFAFRRSNLANFDIILTGKVHGVWIAAPGTGIDASASSTNGWIDCNASYGGAGLPGTNTGAGGNGSAGCALTSSDRIPLNTVINNQRYTQTLGSENLSNATGKNCLVRIRLESGDYIDSIAIGAAS